MKKAKFFTPFVIMGVLLAAVSGTSNALAQGDTMWALFYGVVTLATSWLVTSFVVDLMATCDIQKQKILELQGKLNGDVTQAN